MLHANDLIRISLGIGVLYLIIALLISYRVWRSHRDMWHSLGGKNYFVPWGMSWDWKLRYGLFWFVLFSGRHRSLDDHFLSNAVYFARMLFVLFVAVLLIS
jgi:hypothetical protein